MTQKTKNNTLRLRLNKFIYAGACLVIALSALLPVLIARNASAAQLGTRSLTLESGKPSLTSVQYTFSFVLATLSGTSDVEGIRIQACNTAVGTCNGTAGTDVPNVSGVTFVSQNGNWQGATNFSVDGTGANDCTAGTRVICLKRTDTTNQTTSTARVITLDGINNPSTANTTFFMRITTYDNNTWHSTSGDLQLDTGTVASAVVQTLTVNAAVAEILNFCVGATSVDNATSSIASDCTGVSGTSINIGTLDSSVTNVSPVSTNGGDSNNGVAMIRTNAVNGANVYYDAIQQSGTNHQGTLRISGASCNAGSVNTDQCIDAQGASQSVFNATTDTSEKFGMTIAGINCGSTTSYSCVFATGTYNLVRDAAYDGNGGNTFVSDTGGVSGNTNGGYAWVEGGAATLMASSTGSTSKVIDDEAMVLKFASHPMITTPFGAYTAQADFIAVASY